MGNSVPKQQLMHKIDEFRNQYTSVDVKVAVFLDTQSGGSSAHREERLQLQLTPDESIANLIEKVRSSISIVSDARVRVIHCGQALEADTKVEQLDGVVHVVVTAPPTPAQTTNDHALSTKLRSLVGTVVYCRNRVFLHLFAHFFEYLILGLLVYFRSWPRAFAALAGCALAQQLPRSWRVFLAILPSTFSRNIHGQVPRPEQRESKEGQEADQTIPPRPIAPLAPKTFVPVDERLQHWHQITEVEGDTQNAAVAR